MPGPSSLSKYWLAAAAIFQSQTTHWVQVSEAVSRPTGPMTNPRLWLLAAADPASETSPEQSRAEESRAEESRGEERRGDNGLVHLSKNVTATKRRTRSSDETKLSDSSAPHSHSLAHSLTYSLTHSRAHPVKLSNNQSFQALSSSASLCPSASVPARNLYSTSSIWISN